MAFHNAETKRQAQSCAPGLGRIERLEETFHLLLGNSAAAVCHLQLDHIRLQSGPEHKNPIIAHRLHAISGQVQNQLLDLLLVYLQHRQSFIQLNLNRLPPQIGICPQELYQLSYDMI